MDVNRTSTARGEAGRDTYRRFCARFDCLLPRRSVRLWGEHGQRQSGQSVRALVARYSDGEASGGAGMVPAWVAVGPR